MLVTAITTSPVLFQWMRIGGETLSLRQQSR